MNHYLAKSREVLQITDKKKLYKMLHQEQAELMKHKASFGRKKFGDLKVKASASGIKKTKKNIARIQTRLSQLRLKKEKENQ